MDSDTLFIGLESPQSDKRLATLRTIRQQPDEALRVCSEDGKDLIGRLLELCDQFANSAERWEFIFTALGYADERTAKLALDVFTSTIDNKFMVMAANRINKMSEKDKAEFISPILLADNNNNRTRLSANLLAGNGLIDIKTAIRVGVISDGGCTLPVFDSSTADVWVSELQGPYMQSVRKKFLRLNSDAADTLLMRWNSMDEGLKVWVLSKLISGNVSRFEVMLNSVLQSENSKKVLLTALDCVLGHKTSETFSDAVIVLIRHEDQDIRAKAVLCISDTELLKEMLGREENAEVTGNIILKLAVTMDDVQFFTDYFSDKRWQVRAAAAQAMVQLTPTSIPVLQEFFRSDDTNTRTLAIKCLYDLGMQDWVETSLK